jgi:peptidyl-prolyl cis-trans isomerase A (cyclophilin A)
MNLFAAGARALHALVSSVLLASCLMASGAAYAQAVTQVRFQTTLGPFVVELYPGKTPKTVQNFVQYVQDKHFDGTIFHRVIGDFMVQGGGFTPDMAQKPTRTPIPLEIDRSLKNERGMLAMARTGNPNSATAQFFINVVDNPMLNAPQPDGYGYAVFGKVVSGMETIDAIRSVATRNQNGFQNVPATPIIINTASVLTSP